jgi:ABC-2 type transport system permease protein
MKNILTIATRELKAYFDSLVAYVVLSGTMLGLGLWFFLFQGGFWQVDRATMGRMFDALPWALSFIIIPLMTMRLLAEEKRAGTIELLITMPVKDSEVILGKYLAALGLFVVLLGATLIYPIAMFKFPWHVGELDWAPLFTAYFGIFLYSAAGIAIGMMFSSLTESQIIAFFFTMATLLLLQFIGGLAESLPGNLGDIVSFISTRSRFEPFARGVIDTRAVIYLVSVAVMGLLVSFRALESRKWS